jgi:biotin carboxylase
METVNGICMYETKLENLKRPRGEAIVLDQVAAKTKQEGGKPSRHVRVFSSDGPMLIRHMSNDRPELRGLIKRMTTVDSSAEAVVITDPYSTGCCVAEEIMKRGFSVIALWTKGFAPEMKTHVPLSCGTMNYFKEVEEAKSLAETVTAVYKAAGQLRVVACIAGGEAGLDLADKLSERLTVRTNGTAIPNRRDKKLQQELIKMHGLRSVRQAGGSSFSDVQAFLTKEHYPVVLKPIESAGSDGVKLCHSFDEAQEHFHTLMKSQLVNGGDCASVLCQEFLRGKEYVVDHVSRDGEHKTVMVWVYDKRPVHGSAFVYFGCIPVDSESPEAKILIPYVRGVLDALELVNGPSHCEVMMTPDGPCLVEMNCRAHGGDGNWRPLCLALTGGYSQVEATVGAYLDMREFAQIPDKPPSPFKAAGQEVILVSYSRGVVKATPGFEEIKTLQSYVYLETGAKPGSFVDYTVDLFTGIGSVILMHRDEKVLEADVERIREMERENQLFVYENQAGLMKSPSIKAFGLPQSAQPGDRHLIASDRSDIY